MEGKTNTHYRRVAPRDFFNEAKLLKCLGQLSLHILHGQTPGLFMLRGRPLWLGTVVNAQGAYPLLCFTAEGEELRVFDEAEAGALSEEFRDFIAQP